MNDQPPENHGAPMGLQPAPPETVPVGPRPPQGPEQVEFRRKAKKRVESIQRQLEGLLRDGMRRNRLVVPEEDILHALTTVVETCQVIRDRAKQQPTLDFG